VEHPFGEPKPSLQAPPKRRRRRWRLLRLAVFGAILLTALAAGSIAAAYRTLGASLPSLAALETATGPVGGTFVFGADGDTIMAFYRERRVNVLLDDVPANLKNAVLSVEDWRFYRINLRHGRITQGASTLTQQLARNLFLSHEQTVSRKLREAMLALRIERTYTKHEIFAMYLNQIYFGEGAYGVEAAARTYFGKSVRDLDLIECATLAGLPKNPNGYSPIDHPDRAQRRRNVVLRTMLDHKLITRAQHDSLAALPLVTRPGAEARPIAAYFTEEVRKVVEAEYGVSQLYGGELRVYTSLDLDLQRAAEAALEKRFTELETSLDLPFKRQDYLRAVARDQEPEPRYLQGAIVALDPNTGRVRAMVGGRSFAESRFNRAVQAKRQPGSAFKPFVYLTAMQKGIGPSEILLDTPLVLDMGGGRGLWKPQNYTLTFSGAVSLRYALAKSLNIPSIKLLQQVGTESVIANAHRLGIESNLEPVLSLALGTSEVSLIELTSAYGAIANGGIASKPFFIERITDRRGRVLEQATEYHQEAIDPQSAYLVTSLLESAIDWGTGHAARDVYGFSAVAAGKTGTTDDLGDGWFVGYTPDLVVGVWGGFDERRPIGLAGSYIALPAWCDVMRAYTMRHPSRRFPEPSGILEERICVESGKRASPACPRVQTEIFSDRNKPTSECDLHAGGDQDAAARSLGDDQLGADDLQPPPPPVQAVSP
jgi:penicillin-binding protein 1A